MQRDVVEALLQILAQGQRGALATVVRVSGSTPHKPGARMLLLPDGSTLGTIGGGAIEQAVTEALRKVMDSGEAELFVRDLGHDLAMCCGGRMEVFLEAVQGDQRLWLCGAGHVARHTAALVRSVGFQVTVIDEREELNTEERFPGCRRELLDPGGFLRRFPPKAGDFVLIATHDHHLDETALERALESPAAYVGLVGSKRKTFRLLERIVARKGPQELARVFAPVGLGIGALGPEEIAISIAAELVAVRRGARVPHLRAVDDPRFRKLLGEHE